MKLKLLVCLKCGSSEIRRSKSDGHACPLHFAAFARCCVTRGRFPGHHVLAGLQDVGFVKASFIPPMLLVRTEKPTEGQDWLYELLCGGLHKISSCGGRRYVVLRMRSWLGKHRNGRPT